LKIAIITTHPIQYHAPLFSFLSANSNYSIKVFYTLGNQGADEYDKDFGIKRSWNLDLLSGYEYEFLENVSKNPSSQSFRGVNNHNIINKVREFDPRAIIVYGWKHFSHFTVLNYFKGKVPILFRGDSTTLDDAAANPLFIFFKYTFLKWIYSKVDYVLSPGQASDQYFLKSGIPKSKIIRTPHSVDNQRFELFTEREQSRLSQLKSELLISNIDFVFLFAGKFIEKKNPLLLIKAFELLAQSNDRVKLLLVGNGNLEIEMRKQVASLSVSVSDRIIFLPFQDQHQMKVIYRLANVLVLPSRGPGETWGLSVNESLASGTPVLVSNQCGCAFDLVKQNVNGLIFESNELDDMVSKMELFTDQSFYLQIKARVKEELDYFSFNSFEKALDKISDQIAS
jgi:glycosyltransferase involved in cell wall biosynthesis